MSFTRESTIALNAAPITTPTAMSSTLPCMANSRNSFKNFFICISPVVMIYISRRIIAFYNEKVNTCSNGALSRAVFARRKFVLDKFPEFCIILFARSGFV